MARRSRPDDASEADGYASRANRYPNLSLYVAALSLTAPEPDPIQVIIAILRTHGEGLHTRCCLRHQLDALTQRLHGPDQDLTAADTVVAEAQDAP